MEQFKHNSVNFTDGFWLHLEDTNREKTIPRTYEQLVRTGRIDAMKLEWRNGMPDKPDYCWDSDVAKWMEAAAFSLMKTPDPGLENQLEKIIDYLEQGQTNEGYFNSYFQQIEPAGRWQNLRMNHELYCAGHLIEAAVAYYEATGRRRFLDVMCRFADYLDTVFGPENEGKRPGYPGHQEVELALVKLYGITKDERYLALSKFFIDERGRKPCYLDNEVSLDSYRNQWDLSYFQAEEETRKQNEAVGHAVRACYFYAGMVDVAYETNDEELLAACRRIWSNIIRKKMYITGGIGSCHKGESFSNDYDLPNEEAYAETCAAISLIFFAQRMFKIDKKGEYVDIIERALYNGASSGISIDGKEFYYINPLASYPNGKLANGRRHTPRSKWFDCSCCPPNIARLRASVGQYFYDSDDKTIWINLFNSSVSKLELGGDDVEITQKTEYPWNGKVDITVNTANSKNFEIAVRLPGWCDDPSLLINGSKLDLDGMVKDGYAYIGREWNDQDHLELNLPMPVKMVRSHPKVRHNSRRIALMRGPLVYCIEACDNGDDLNSILLPSNIEFKSIYNDSLLKGITVISFEAFRVDHDKWGNELYSTRDVELKKHCIKAIPYYAWGNRDFDEMLVWMNVL